MSESSTERRIALFVDFENLVTNTGITAANFNLQPSLDRLLEKGKIIFRRAYCDWSRFQDAKAHLHEFGVELVDVPPSTRAGKNGADMRLVIDALELNYARHHIDTFVIASGDSDFCPLAYKLRENDKFVIGLAVKEATSPFFVKACDEFIYLKSDGRRSEPRHRRSSRRDGASVSGDATTTESTSSTTPPSSGASSGSSTNPSNKRAPREIPLIAREVVASLLSRATGPINPSLIKETIVRKEPDFDEREAGFSTFSRLLEAMEREGLCTRLQQGRQWYVTSKEGAPDAKGAKTPESLENHEAPQFDEEDEIPDPPDHAD